MKDTEDSINEKAWERAMSKPIPIRKRSAQQTYNDNTRKLIPTGDAHRDRLVAASINLRRTE